MACSEHLLAAERRAFVPLKVIGRSISVSRVAGLLPIADIRKPDDGRELSNAGKLMGLSAYGQIRQEWIAPISAYFFECSMA